MKIDIEEIKTLFPNVELNEERMSILNSLGEKRCFLNILGKAGSGKSVTLSLLKDYLESKGNSVVVCTTTGVASALLNANNPNVKASTIHSTFGIKPHDILGSFDPSNLSVFGQKRENLENLIINTDYLFIDECSMMTSDMFDFLIEELKYFRMGSLMNIILFGDIFQLPPVVKISDKEIKKYYEERYNSNTFYFNSHAFQDLNFKTIVLNKVYRQKDDLQFTEILNRIRDNKVTDSDIKTINSRFLEEDDLINWELDNEDAVRICTTNKECETYNTLAMDMVDSPLVEIPSTITGNFIYSDEFKSGAYPETLRIKIGAKVMITRNAPVQEDNSRAYVNGDVGIVQEINDDNLVIELKNSTVILYPERVSHYDYSIDREDSKILVEPKETGSWTNFPIKISWANTVHKIQGQTLEKGILSFGHWTPEASIYVGLSRFTHLTDFVLSRPIKKSDIKVNKESLDFLKSI